MTRSWGRYGPTILFLVALYGGIVRADRIVAVDESYTDAHMNSTTLPTCASQCMLLYESNTYCELTNLDCVCKDKIYNKLVAECVEINCSVREGLVSKRLSNEQCKVPSRDRRGQIRNIGLIGGSLAFLAYLLRLYAKIDGCAGLFGADDWIMTVVVLENIPLTWGAWGLPHLGLGLDMWNIPFSHLTRILYLYFWDELVYFTALPLLKISILCFYLRIFTRKSFRHCIYVLIGLNVVYLFCFSVATIFQCTPVNGAWQRWDASSWPGRCDNVNLQSWLSAVINIVLDILALGFPIPEVLRLALGKREKMQIVFMFSFAFFMVTVISILRLQTLIRFADTNNFTQDYVEVGYWSTIEVHLGIICACTPAMRSLKRKWFGSATRQTVTSSSETRRASSKAVGGAHGGDGSVSGCGGHGVPPICMSPHPAKLEMSQSTLGTTTGTGRTSPFPFNRADEPHEQCITNETPRPYDSDSMIPLVDVEAGEKQGQDGYVHARDGHDGRDEHDHGDHAGHGGPRRSHSGHRLSGHRLSRDRLSRDRLSRDRLGEHRLSGHRLSREELGEHVSREQSQNWDARGVQEQGHGPRQRDSEYSALDDPNIIRFSVQSMTGFGEKGGA